MSRGNGTKTPSAHALRDALHLLQPALGQLKAAEEQLKQELASPGAASELVFDKRLAAHSVLSALDDLADAQRHVRIARALAASEEE